MADFDGELRVVYTPATQPGEVTVVSTTAVTEAEAARDAAQAARDQAVAAAGTFTAPADSVIGGLIGDGVSDTSLAVAAKVAAVTPTTLGLGSVDNTSDLAKPVSTATQIALDLKANAGGLTRGKTATNYQMVACVLRRVDTSTWEFLNDSGHAPTGVTSVARMTSPFRLRLTYDFTATKVGTLSATNDEAFAKADLRVGASVGTTYADLYFYLGAAGSTEVDPGLLSTAGANIWVHGVFEV